MLDWWRHLSRGAKFAGYIGVIGTAIVSVAGAWAIVEPGVPAHRAYVREYVPPKVREVLDPALKPLLTAQAEGAQATRSLQIDQAESACEKVADEIIVMSVLLPKETDATTRERKAFQLNQKKQRYDDLDSKLKGWRAGHGCPYSTGQ